VVCLDSLILCPPQHGSCKLCTSIFMKNNKHSQQYMSWLERTNNFCSRDLNANVILEARWVGREVRFLYKKIIIQHVFSCLKFGQVKFSITCEEDLPVQSSGLHIFLCMISLLSLSLSISVSAILLEGISTCFFISVNKERQKLQMSVQKRLYQEASRQ
jgi:hypothetical protein